MNALPHELLSTYSHEKRMKANDIDKSCWSHEVVKWYRGKWYRGK